MPLKQAHIIHVGDMTNKGTEALIRTDIDTLKDLLDGGIVNVSTTDVDGTLRLKIPCDNVYPVMVEIPFTFADHVMKNTGKNRETIQYKVFAFFGLILMFFQSVALILSSILTRIGLRGFYRNELVKSMYDSDVVISCSDENFKETASLLPLNIYWKLTWWSLLFERTLEVTVAKFFNKPVIMFPNSVGPFRTWFGNFLAKIALNNCKEVLIREPISYEIVNSMNIAPETYLTSDSALLYESKENEHDVEISHPVVGVCAGVYSNSISNEAIIRYIEDHAKALDDSIDKFGFNVLLIPHFISGLGLDDLRISELILAKMKRKDKARLLVIDGVEKFKIVLREMDMVISSKMHPAVLAISSFVPSLSIAYDHKQIGFYNNLGQPECVIKLQDVNYESLSSKIVYVWSSRTELKESLMTRVPEIKKDIREKIERSLGFLFE